MNAVTKELEAEQELIIKSRNAKDAMEFILSTIGADVDSLVDIIIESRNVYFYMTILSNIRIKDDKKRNVMLKRVFKNASVFNCILVLYSIIKMVSLREKKCIFNQLLKYGTTFCCATALKEIEVFPSPEMRDKFIDTVYEDGDHEECKFVLMNTKGLTPAQIKKLKAVK